MTQTEQTVAAGTAGVAVWSTASACALPMVGPALCPILIGAFGLAAALGTAEVSVAATSAKAVGTQAKDRISNVLPRLSGQNALINYVVEYGQSVTKKTFTPVIEDKTSGRPSDAVLMLAITELRGITSRGGLLGIKATEYALSIQARAVLKDKRDGKVLADRTYRYLSAPRPDAEWAAQGGEMILNEIDRASRSKSS